MQQRVSPCTETLQARESSYRSSPGQRVLVQKLSRPESLYRSSPHRGHKCSTPISNEPLDFCWSPLSKELDPSKSRGFLAAGARRLCERHLSGFEEPETQRSTTPWDQGCWSHPGQQASSCGKAARRYGLHVPIIIFCQNSADLHRFRTVPTSHLQSPGGMWQQSIT